MIEHVQIGQKWLYQKSFPENDAKLFESAQYLNKKVYFISHNHEGENGLYLKGKYYLGPSFVHFHDYGRKGIAFHQGSEQNHGFLWIFVPFWEDPMIFAHPQKPLKNPPRFKNTKAVACSRAIGATELTGISVLAYTTQQYLGGCFQPLVSGWTP